MPEPARYGQRASRAGLSREGVVVPSGAVRDDEALRATFDAVYPTLGVEGRDIPFAATITPHTLAAPAQTERPAVTLDSLPHLSIALDGDARGADSLPRTRELDVIGLLGEGGMGRVLLGRQRSLDRDVAIKTVKPELRGTTHADALVREGVITGTLEHPNITPVHQLGIDHEGRPVLVMKRIVGTSWADLVENPDSPFWEKLDALPDDRLHAHLEILGSVANALAYAHSRGVIHRDVKPDNVMIGEFGEVYLVDFGIATKVREGERPKGLVGTPAFMAPEMVDERMPIGPETDVYLLGATLHFLLARTSRHHGSTLPEVLSAAFVSAPHDYDANVPTELAALANSATARDPSERPRSAIAFRKAITRYFTHRSANALADVATTRLDALDALDPESADASALARLVSECRFGFLMALREWPECPSAKLGLVRCLERIVVIETERGNLGAAEAALAELDHKAEALVARVDALRTAQRLRDGAAARLEAIEADQDLGVAAQLRRKLAMAFLVIAVLISTVVHVRQYVLGEGAHASGAVLLAVAAGLVGIGLVVGVLGREALFQNAINRKLTTTFFMVIVFQFLHRFVAYHQGLDSRVVLPADMLINAAAIFTMGVFAVRLWMLPAVLLVVGALLCVALPLYTELFYFLAMSSTLGVIGFTFQSDGAERSTR